LPFLKLQTEISPTLQKMDDIKERFTRDLH
jgi:hypothetical protein